MTLRQIVEERKTGWPHSPCVTLKHGDAPPCLRLEFANGNLVLLPWARFVGAYLESEKLVIEFHEREVTVTGKSLDKIGDAIGDLSLAGLRSMPEEYGALADGKPYVTKIVCRER